VFDTGTGKATSGFPPSPAFTRRHRAALRRTLIALPGLALCTGTPYRAYDFYAAAETVERIRKLMLPARRECIRIR
jgi:hypothetical protein